MQEIQYRADFPVATEQVSAQVAGRQHHTGHSRQPSGERMSSHRPGLPRLLEQRSRPCRPQTPVRDIHQFVSCQFPLLVWIIIRIRKPIIAHQIKRPNVLSRAQSELLAVCACRLSGCPAAYPLSFWAAPRHDPFYRAGVRLAQARADQLPSWIFRCRNLSLERVRGFEPLLHSLEGWRQTLCILAKLAPQAGFEPATNRVEADCSVQLSYQGLKLVGPNGFEPPAKRL